MVLQCGDGRTLSVKKFKDTDSKEIVAKCMRCKKSDECSVQIRTMWKQYARDGTEDTSMLCWVHWRPGIEAEGTSHAECYPQVRKWTAFKGPNHAWCEDCETFARRRVTYGHIWQTGPCIMPMSDTGLPSDLWPANSMMCAMARQFNGVRARWRATSCDAVPAV